jgi:hypothetical protein
LLAKRGELTKLELSAAQAAPAFSGADERAEHRLQHRLLSEAAGNDLEASALLDEQPFEQVCRPRDAAMRDTVSG